MVTMAEFTVSYPYYHVLHISRDILRIVCDSTAKYYYNTIAKALKVSTC